MRILVTGSRLRDETKDYKRLRDVLEGVLIEYRLDRCDPSAGGYAMPDPGKITVIHGGAKGMDTCADQWCGVNKLLPEVHKADWDKHGRSAGPIRNQEMLKTGIDLVLAFPSPTGKGTQHMIEIAKKAGVPVRVFD